MYFRKSEIDMPNAESVTLARENRVSWLAIYHSLLMYPIQSKYMQFTEAAGNGFPKIKMYFYIIRREKKGKNSSEHYIN